MLNGCKIFAGSSHPELAAQITQSLGIELGAVTISKFASGEIYVNLEESVRGRDVFIIQTTEINAGCINLRGYLIEIENIYAFLEIESPDIFN